MNKELKYLVSIGLEAVQLIDVLAPSAPCGRNGPRGAGHCIAAEGAVEE